jgi:hypothetical protein
MFVNGAFAPTITTGAVGEPVIDLLDLNWSKNAKVTVSGHQLMVTSGPNAETLDDVVGPAGKRWAALTDDAGGIKIVPAIIENAADKIVDGTHHPLAQHSPNNGPDVIVLLGGNDTAKGLGGNDAIVAGAAGDVLYGGAGANDFIFESLKASPLTNPDAIMDFSHAQHDEIDLFALRAAVPGGGPLVFIGGQSFVHYHHLHPGVLGMVRYAGGELQITVNGGNTTPFEVVVHGIVHAGDLIL